MTPAQDQALWDRRAEFIDALANEVACGRICVSDAAGAIALCGALSVSGEAPPIEEKATKPGIPTHLAPHGVDPSAPPCTCQFCVNFRNNVRASDARPDSLKNRILRASGGEAPPKEPTFTFSEWERYVAKMQRAARMRLAGEEVGGSAPPPEKGPREGGQYVEGAWFCECPKRHPVGVYCHDCRRYAPAAAPPKEPPAPVDMDDYESLRTLVAALRAEEAHVRAERDALATQVGGLADHLAYVTKQWGDAVAERDDLAAKNAANQIDLVDARVKMLAAEDRANEFVARIEKAVAMAKERHLGCAGDCLTCDMWRALRGVRAGGSSGKVERT